MFKKIQGKEIYLLILLVVVFVGCSDKDENLISKADFEGNWIINSSTTAIRINNMSFIDYYVQNMDYTQDEAIIYYTYLTSDITGNFLYNSDGTYVITWDGEEIQRGNWDIGANAEQILLDENTTFEMTIDVLSICETALLISFTESGVGDVNEDGNPDLIEFIYNFGLIK